MNSNEIIAEVKKTKYFPPLYKTVKRGSKTKRRVWKVYVTESDKGIFSVFTEVGDEGGKMKISVVATIKQGVNLGKKNETTPEEQAFNVALSYFKEKLRTFKPDNIEMKNEIYPMKGYDYREEKNKKYLVLPAFIQRKLDGVRCISNKYQMLSMRRLPIIAFPHIKKDLDQIFIEAEKTIGKDIDFYLDGELYDHYTSHQKISGLSRQKEIPTSEKEIAQAKKIKYFVFDCFFPQKLEIPYIKRLEVLRKLLTNEDYSQKYENVRCVETYLLNNHNDLEEYLKHFVVEEGYEGAIMRNMMGIYESSNLTSRSKNIFKYKMKEYEDYEIVDIKQADGPQFGILIVVRITETGNLFEITGSGPEKYRREILKNKKKYIGCKLRFSYYGRTDDFVPKHATPVYKNDSYIFSFIDE